MPNRTQNQALPAKKLSPFPDILISLSSSGEASPLSPLSQKMNHHPSPSPASWSSPTPTPIQRPPPPPPPPRTTSPTRSPTKTTTTKLNHLYVLVTAHPDDESMFFLPTVVNRLRKGGPFSQIWLLCLTTGNYDGLGRERSQELRTLVATKQIIPFDNLMIIDHEQQLPDHPTKRWSIPVASHVIESAIKTTLLKQRQQRKLQSMPNKISFITFDSLGVSGHVNHRDTYLAVRHLMQQYQRQRQAAAESPGQPQQQMFPGGPLLETWCLKSVDRWAPKYFPIFEWFLLLMYAVFFSLTIAMENLLGQRPPVSNTSSSQGFLEQVHAGLASHTEHMYAFADFEDTDNLAADDEDEYDPDDNTDEKQEQEENTQPTSTPNLSATTNKRKKKTLSSKERMTYRLHDPVLNWNAMATHESQFVWYRRLFVVFSCYSYVNRLQKMTTWEEEDHGVDDCVTTFPEEENGETAAAQKKDS